MKISILLCLILSLFSLYSADNHRVTFSAERYCEKEKLPHGWYFKGKLFTAKPTYEVVFDRKLKKNILRITSNSASGAILYDITGILQKYPIMRWKWRVDSLPKGADGRNPKLDDQAVAIYIGVGRVSSKSVSFRWDTETPKLHRGKVEYCGGMVKVDWITLRNKEDDIGMWYVEQVNAAEELKRICGGKLPESEVALSICSNSQYTKSKIVAEISYIEFLPPDAAQ